MIIFCIIARGRTILAEYGTGNQDLSSKILTILNKNQTPGTRLVPYDNCLCAVMNKLINSELISFAAIIEHNDERDNSFNFLDSVATFFEKEASNPKMTTEMNAFLSKNIKLLLVILCTN